MKFNIVKIFVISTYRVGFALLHVYAHSKYLIYFHQNFSLAFTQYTLKDHSKFNKTKKFFIFSLQISTSNCPLFSSILSLFILIIPIHLLSNFTTEILMAKLHPEYLSISTNKLHQVHFELFSNLTIKQKKKFFTKPTTDY